MKHEDDEYCENGWDDGDDDSDAEEAREFLDLELIRQHLMRELRPKFEN